MESWQNSQEVLRVDVRGGYHMKAEVIKVIQETTQNARIMNS